MQCCFRLTWIPCSIAPAARKLLPPHVAEMCPRCVWSVAEFYACVVLRRTCESD